MVRHENEKGSVNVSTNVYTEIVGTAASNWPLERNIGFWTQA